MAAVAAWRRPGAAGRWREEGGGRGLAIGTSSVCSTAIHIDTKKKKTPLPSPAGAAISLPLLGSASVSGHP